MKIAVEIPLKNASAQAIKKKTGKAVFHNTVVSNTSAQSNKPTKITPVNTIPTAAAQKPFRKIKINILAGKRDTQWRKPKFTNKGGSNTDKALMGNICQSPQSHKYGKNSNTPRQKAAEAPSIKAVKFKASNDSSCRLVVRFPGRHSNSKPAATSRQPPKSGTMLRYRHPCLLCTQSKNHQQHRPCRHHDTNGKPSVLKNHHLIRKMFRRPIIRVSSHSFDNPVCLCR